MDCSHRRAGRTVFLQTPRDRLWPVAHCPSKALLHPQDQPQHGAHPAARWVRRAAGGGAHVAAAAWARSRSRAPSATLFMWLLRAVAAQEVAVALAVRPRPARASGQGQD